MGELWVPGRPTEPKLPRDTTVYLPQDRGGFAPIALSELWAFGGDAMRATSDTEATTDITTIGEQYDTSN